MDRTATKNTRLLGLALTTALAGATLTGCAATSAPPASISAGKAEAALAKGNFGSAVGHAEAAVMAEPRNGAYRAMLGAAYLDTGRFASAATSFNDALALGDTSPRTALSLALALSADGKYTEAVAVLRDWEKDIAPGDLGLAYALAGQAGRGVYILSNALRGGENTPKVRQNLAYAYALAGQWREARLMAAEDVPGNQLGDRMAAWATEMQPGTERTRVAALLSVPADVRDPGQPVQLALANFPTAQQLAALAPAAPAQALAIARAPVAPAPQPATRSGSELPPIGDAAGPAFASSAPTAAKPAKPQSFQAAFPAATVSAAPFVAMDSGRFAQAPAAKPAPARVAAAPAPAPAKAAVPGITRTLADGTHLIQLGSFASDQGARRAWGIYLTRYPELAGHEMVITEAVVRGKHYWRVAAAGYDASSSRSMCGRVRSASSEGCLAYSQSRPLPGAIDTGRRLAIR